MRGRGIRGRGIEGRIGEDEFCIIHINHVKEEVELNVELQEDTGEVSLPSLSKTRTPTRLPPHDTFG